MLNEETADLRGRTAREDTPRRDGLALHLLVYKSCGAGGGVIFAPYVLFQTISDL